MGVATIVSGGDEGRYTISVDTGEANRTALVARYTDGIDQLAVMIENETTTLEAMELALDNTFQERLDLITSVYVSASASGASESVMAPLTLAYSQAMQVYQFERMKVVRQQALVDNYKLQRKNLIAKRERLNALVLTFERLAWCADFTEDTPPSSVVATIEIPGESDLILIANGCRAWNWGDGLLVDRALMSPELAFFNAAVLPGWQKWMPTYRWGTCTAIDHDANVMDVALADLHSSAQGLPVNQSASLARVPVQYMTCNSRAFDVGDRVVVIFNGQEWSDPYVIGFVDNPEPCIDWPEFAFWGIDLQRAPLGRPTTSVTVLVEFLPAGYDTTSILPLGNVTSSLVPDGPPAVYGGEPSAFTVDGSSFPTGTLWSETSIDIYGGDLSLVVVDPLSAILAGESVGGPAIVSDGVCCYEVNYTVPSVYAAVVSTVTTAIVDTRTHRYEPTPPTATGQVVSFGATTVIVDGTTLATFCSAPATVRVTHTESGRYRDYVLDGAIAGTLTLRYNPPAL